jgi:hypothetical protein
LFSNRGFPFFRKAKVAIYKYHTNEFVYKNEGVGAMDEQSDQIGKIFGKKNWRFS